MVTNYLTYKLADTLKTTARIDDELFKQHQVKRGLRNEDGSGVLVGLTKIGNVLGYRRGADGKAEPIPGELLYRGYEISDLVQGVISEKRFGFEEIAYLLLSGKLPDEEELEQFKALLLQNMPLPHEATMSILQLRGSNIMNILARSVLELYTFDDDPDDRSREKSMEQSIELISRFPVIIAYAYNALRQHKYGQSMHIRLPQAQNSLAENFLYMLRADYTPLEARVLDLLLILQAEHGGGNNSTFTVRVTSSSNTDIYSSIAAGIGSLKGPLHGGANLKVVGMFHHLKENVSDWSDVDEIDAYLQRILGKEVYDQTGLIYGIGHAVYTISDPRVAPLRGLARSLAVEKDRLEEFEFLELLEQRAVEAVRIRNGKQATANVDFYSGFVYELMGLPQEIYTPLFAMSRIVGWCAHRNEELNFAGRRIIRPAYRNVLAETHKYVPLEDR